MGINFGKRLALSLLLGAVGAASPINYGVNLLVGGTGHVIGSITTDGTLGTLGAGNFVDWNLQITDGVNAPDTLRGPLSGNNSTVFVYQADQSATSASILFNFSAADNGYFFFESTAPGNNDFVCFGPGGAGAFNETCAVGVASNVEGISLNGGPQNTALSGTQVVASAAVPEPASFVLLAMGLGVGAFWKQYRKVA